MAKIVKVAERKARATGAVRAAADALMADLSRYARSSGGRFLVFGSAAAGTLRADSDFDVMLEFPESLELAAWRFVEEACRTHGLRGDIASVATASAAFIARVRARGLVLQ